MHPSRGCYTLTRVSDWYFDSVYWLVQGRSCTGKACWLWEGMDPCRGSVGTDRDYIPIVRTLILKLEHTGITEGEVQIHSEIKHFRRFAVMEDGNETQIAIMVSTTSQSVSHASTSAISRTSVFDVQPR